MAFDIEKMKADGVSSHLIELASMNQETFLLLIARRLEHDKLFQQFMGENAGSIEAMYPYAVAAGLMSEEDRLWLIDGENPYKEKTYTIKWLDGGGEPMFSDTTNVKVGDMVTAPYHSIGAGSQCDWNNDAQVVCADCSEEHRTFEFTQELADTATDYVVEFNTFCQL